MLTFEWKDAKKHASIMHDALEAICKDFEFNHYLEIGVQEGGSLSIVLANSPELRSVTLVDTWGAEYGGTGRGNHQHIEKLIEKHGFKEPVIYGDGNSHRILPGLRSGYFDLILVDGDHSREGAAQDLEEAWRLVMPEGVIVFDDIACPPHPWLLEVWKDFLKSHPLSEPILRDTSRAYGVAACVVKP